MAEVCTQPWRELCPYVEEEMVGPCWRMEPQLPGVQGGASSPLGGREWGKWKKMEAERNNNIWRKGG